jgi:hypothetical protein
MAYYLTTERGIQDLSRILRLEADERIHSLFELNDLTRIFE